MIKKENSNKFLFIMLGALTAFAPLVTDMYLPALPGMTGSFNTSMSMVQLGLTFSIIGLAMGQLFFGPLSDKYGRRPLLLASMLLFIVSTVACVFSVNIHMFIWCRLIQGIGASGGIVISRSVATDKFSGRDLARAMAIIGAINGVAPVAAPVAGGFFTDLIGWRGIFTILLGIGVVLLLCEVNYKETLAAESRVNDGLKRLLKTFGKVLHNRRFVYYVVQFGFCYGVLFGNIASSPFIMQQHYEYSALAFSAFFGINSIGIAAGSAISLRFRRTETANLVGCLMMLVMAFGELFALSGGCGFWVYESLLFLMMLSMGTTFTAVTSLSMNCERQNAGTASAILGATSFAFGGLVSPIVGMGDMLTTTGIVFAVSAFFSMLFAILASRKGD